MVVVLFFGGLVLFELFDGFVELLSFIGIKGGGCVGVVGKTTVFVVLVDVVEF